MLRTDLTTPVRQTKGRISGFLSQQDGSATIEFVMWLPLFLFVFGLIAEASLIFAGETTILRVVQDANRAMSIGRLTTASATETQIKNNIAKLAPDAQVTTTVTNGIIHSTVSVPVSDLTFTGLVPQFKSLNVKVSAQMMSES